MEAWTRLHGAIVDGGLEVDCRPIIDWICVALTLKTGNDKTPLSMPRPTVPLADGDLLRHMQHILTCHLPGMYPSLQRFQGLLIATHIWEVAVDMRRDTEAKELECKAEKEKGIPDLLGFNLTQLPRTG